MSVHRAHRLLSESPLILCTLRNRLSVTLSGFDQLLTNGSIDSCGCMATAPNAAMKILFVFIASLVGATAALADEGVVGQYQLVSAVVETHGQKVSVEQHSLFRIDTKTGKTWVYTSAEGKNGKFVAYWREVSDLPGEPSEN
jgi:hypothetical protein